MEKTLQQFDQVVDACREIFLNKTRDYGTAWRILRPSSLTDQLFIKARRIRSIEESGTQKVADSIEQEYIGLVNYGVLALIQMSTPDEAGLELGLEKASALYEQQIAETKALMQSKNHDYGEVWRDMRISSMTDLILMKLLRIKQIEDNAGRTRISEGIDANYMDIVNYAIFALIKLKEQE